MNIRKKLSILTFMLFLTLMTIIGLSLWTWNRMQRLHETIVEGQQLLNHSQKVMGLMKDIVFDLFSPTMYDQIRSLTYSPRSVATYKTWQKAVDEYQHIFMDFMDDRELMILQDDELQDIYETALTLNQKALNQLDIMSAILFKLQETNLSGEALYSMMQKDESLAPFFQEFRDTSYYFTNTFESFMNHLSTSFQKQSLKLGQQMYILFLLVSIISGIVSLLYTAMISREILQKISLVGRTFEKISRGDFSTTSLPTKDTDELSSLIVSINALSEDLKENVNSILNLTRDMGTALNEGSSREEMMDIIAETIINDTAAETSAVYLYDPLEDRYTRQALRGDRIGLVQYLPGKSWTGTALKGRKVVLDGGETTIPAASPEDRQARAFMAVPLIIRDEVRGFLTALIHSHNTGFSDLGITRMTNFAEYVSLSLENHSKYLELLEKREAEYNALQSQVQPHFIYNILNGFIGLNRMGLQEKLEKAILSLREMLRYVTDQNRWTTLGEEVRFLKSYCDLQKIRFGERLNYSFTIPATLEHFQIPKLLLQPLVENSIIHGLEPKEEGGRLSLKADHSHKDGYNRVILNLEDTGCGFEPDLSSSGKNVGLRNVKERLRMTYPGSSFLIRSAPGQGTTVVMTLISNQEEESE